MPTYLLIGLSEEKVDNSTPYELEPYLIAYNKKQKERDTENWQLGIYLMRAMQVVFNFGKEKIEYFDKPMSETYEQEHKELTKEEKLKKQKEIFAMLEIMQANFELSKKGKE